MSRLFPLKIAIYSKPFAPSVGGMERMAELLAREFSHFGSKVDVFTDTVGVDLDSEALFSIHRKKSFWELLMHFRQVDVILFMGVSLKVLPIAILSGRKIVLSHHGAYVAESLLGQFVELFKRFVARFFFNISVSNFIRKRIFGKGVVIHNAYDDSMFISDPAIIKDRDFVFCGRLVSDKGVDVLLRSFKSVIVSYPSAQLTIIGDGPERNQFELLSSKLGVAANVIFKGVLQNDELVNELVRHRCMVVPSLCEEAFGISALEGLACCGQVIVSDRGGLPEAVGSCGVVVPALECSLSKAMRESLANSEENKMSDKRKFLMLHKADFVANKYIHVLYERVGRIKKL